MWQIALGVIGALVLAGVITVVSGNCSFRRNFNDMAKEVLSNQQPDRGIVTDEDLAGLPKPVQRYLRYSGIIGKEEVTTVRLRQKGVLRRSLKDSWKDLEAVEYYSVTPPAFVWLGQMAMGPFKVVAARDSYINGQGRMLIKMLGIKTIDDVTGQKMDYSCLLRYLNEMMWFPSAFLNDNIHWDAIDDTSARVTLTDASLIASAVMHFDEQGALTTFVSDRYHQVNGVYVKDTWETPITGYGEFNGLKLPIKGEAVWRTSGEDFTYIKAEITALEYNVAELYE